MDHDVEEQASENFRKAVLTFRRCFTHIAALRKVFANERRGAYLFLFQTIEHALEIAKELEMKLEHSNGRLESYDYARLTSKTVFLPVELCTARPGLLNIVESYNPRNEFVAFYDTISCNLREHIFCCDIIPIKLSRVAPSVTNCQGGDHVGGCTPTSASSSQEATAC